MSSSSVLRKEEIKNVNKPSKIAEMVGCLTMLRI